MIGGDLLSEAMLKPVLFSSLKKYDRTTFLADLGAGLTVGVVALPLAMAFAIACGARDITPATGLVTAVVAGLLISMFSGSRFQIGGPTGAFVVLIAGVVSQFGMGGLLGCTLLAGIFLLLFGIFRMGGLIRFIPFPVTTGFTSGIAVTIFCTQIQDILGLSIPAETPVPADFMGKWACYITHIGTFNPWALGLTLLTIAVILLTRRLAPKWPAMLVGMLVATVISVLFDLGAHGVRDIHSQFGDLPAGLPIPSLPPLEWSTLPSLIQPAFVIALLAAIESLLSASVADGMTSTRHKPNAELLAQGIGNIGSALFGGLPATGAIARTATNIKAGAKTPVSGVVHALTLLLILVLAGPYAALVPLPALAGILAVVCWTMADIPKFVNLLRGPRPDAAVLVITFLLTVLFDLVLAVEVGVVLAALLFIGRMAQLSGVKALHDEALGVDGKEDHSRSMSLRVVPEGVEVFDIQGPFFFGAVEHFKDIVLGELEHDVHYIVLRMRLVPAMDATGLNVLTDFAERCRARGVCLLFCGVQPQPLEIIRHAPLYRLVKMQNICENIDAALARIRVLMAQTPGAHKPAPIEEEDEEED